MGRFKPVSYTHLDVYKRQAAYKAGMDQHSPSRAMYRAGQDTVQGLILGLSLIHI